MTESNSYVETQLLDARRELEKNFTGVEEEIKLRSKFEHKIC